MKRFVAVTQQGAGGRTFTRIYPARTVEGNPSVLPARLAPDIACLCGYLFCPQDGPCAPSPAEQSRPCCTAAARGAACGCFEDYTTRYLPRAPPAAVSVEPEPYGCVRRRGMSPRECVESGHYWCDFNKPPAEPARRPGWATLSERKNGEPVYVHETYHPYSPVYFSCAGVWRVYGDAQDHTTLEAAMERAEALARGES
jgi:hypothetical protein